MRPPRTVSGRQLADISRLADESIVPERRAAAEAGVESSPDLRRLLERERAAVALLRGAREQDRAPEELRRRIAAERREATPAWRLASLGGGLLAAAAVIAVALVVVLGGGTTTGPSVAQAARLASRGAAAGAPRADRRAPGYLAQSVGEVYFPNWSHSLGWAATGQRIDRLDGHRAVTVYYRAGRLAVAYTVLSLPALRQPGGSATRLGGLTLRRLRLAGSVVVTWREDGRTCVLSGRGVSVRQLEGLAAWRG
jgi:hypothetical protein